MSEAGKAPAAATSSLSIHRGMRVEEMLRLLPSAEQLLARYGLSCADCALHSFETLEEGCRLHGFEESDIEDLVTDLNAMLQERPVHPPLLHVSKDAAEALLGIMETEKKMGSFLRVCFEKEGGFSLEFSSEAPVSDDKIFFHEDVPAVQVVASGSTLLTIGGGTISLRNGRFALDLPGDQ